MSPVGPPADGGILLVDKPSGPTSHDVVGRVRRVLGTRRVGHAGTLDPMATGLLVVAVDRATRLLGQLALTTKSYTATVRLGRATTTDDAEGEPLDGADASGITEQDLDLALARWTGDIEQVPSAVSAVKVDGRRAYDIVRTGGAVELAARPVTVSRFERTSALRPAGELRDVDVVVDCSTGTYVRALARDVGRALGVGAHLTALRRTRVGPFDVADAVDVYGPAGPAPRGTPDPVPDGDRDRVAGRLLPVGDVARLAFGVRELDEREAVELSFGRPVAAAGIDGVHAALRDGALVALLTESGGRARPTLVWSPAG
ncbi:tRNA pseudouridine(55) synthase TruB [Nakamurella endophytica]|uniref:tRNA pseudouridine synthase B n=1 Tax=Nakamurella endophytica TaxID=1748367 RepID=A0A917WCU3_9ACTN|nr:tRNA pseudouridine(55) synthase TruB [Nakamurella endophytica]GGL95462.1 tRNA pseudouridine synthase B [Nakamurella endophytica]